MDIKDFTLKAVRFNERQSDETNCFSATLCYKGVPVANGKNSGQGAATEFFWVGPAAADGRMGYKPSALGKEIEAFAKAYALAKPEVFDFEHVESLFDELLEAHVNAAQDLKWLKRNSKNNICVHIKGTPSNEWLLFPLPKVPSIPKEWMQQRIAAIRAKYNNIDRIGHEELGLL